VGIGYDIHRLEAGRKLILAGVDVPFEKGLIGHSDGDVVFHAVIDALLGACHLPDIGELFPDTDPRYKDVASGRLLTEVMTKVRGAGFVPNNIDCVIHAERPKLSAYKPAMADSIARLVGIGADRVAVKAKTNEAVGPVGAGEAIAATVVVSVVRPAE
jgi:2-C-methyl-D-erythritol 2,4-cyclodiphosphate synthase